MRRLSMGLVLVLGCTPPAVPESLDAGELDAGTLDAADVALRDAPPSDAWVRDLGPAFTSNPYTMPAPTVVAHDPSVSLSSACAVAAMQPCSPSTAEGCGSGETCDLAADGTFQCFGLASPVAIGGACDGLHGPYCDVGATCVGTGTGAATCARFCCADAECGAGEHCRPTSARGVSAGHVGVCVRTDAPPLVAPQIGNHRAIVEGRGFLPPWTSWRDALESEMQWYASACPDVVGYPKIASETHFDGACRSSGFEVIAAMQDGTGILSYLAYDSFSVPSHGAWLGTARRLGDYLIDEASSPADGTWPSIPRSSGHAHVAPQTANCGVPGDMPYELEPDKAALAAYALLQLGHASGDAGYSDAALHVAQVLVANMVTADATHSPWPFRVDYRDGTSRDDVSSNMTFALRLFDGLIDDGHGELTAPRDALWTWILTEQLPSAAGDGALWANFFEDHDEPSNRNAWAPLHLARYLLERGDTLDPDWRVHVQTLLDFVDRTFVDEFRSFRVCIEQDIDRKPFGGILSTYGAVLAEYAARTGSVEHRARAYAALALCIYAIDFDGCPSDLALETRRGGWQEDAHTDVVHNFVAALTAFPEWGD